MQEPFLLIVILHLTHACTQTHTKNNIGGRVVFVFSLTWTDFYLCVLFAHLDVYLTFILDINPHRVSNDLATLVEVVANHTEGWHHVSFYQQVVSYSGTDYV